MTIPLGIFNPAQAAFLLGIAAVLGACLGSFVNCLAWRLANGESVEPIPPFTGKLVLRDSVTLGPYFK